MMIVAVLPVLSGCSSSLDRDHELALNKAAGLEVLSTTDGVEVRLPEKALFDFDQSQLRSDAIAVIDRSSVLVKRSSKPIRVDGYTDNVGTRAYNDKLSLARATAVANALIARGVDSARISTKGHAFDDPIASNDSAQGRALNRRTEIVVIGESMNTLMGPEK
jgi:outer membrane protein OmpA-like peptidoglycan-associated protein